MLEFTRNKTEITISDTIYDGEVEIKITEYGMFGIQESLYTWLNREQVRKLIEHLNKQLCYIAKQQDNA